MGSAAGEIFAMKLLVDRLTDQPSALDFEILPSWWHARTGPAAEHVFDLDEPLRLTLRARSMGEDLLLEGEIAGTAASECSRCVARYRHALRDSFRLVLEPAGDRVPADPEGARALAKEGLCLGEEIDAGWYRGPEITLDGFVAELVALSIPIQPLCREDCAGLCPTCGIDRNESECACGESKADSPFSVLAALRIPESPGDS
jgi:uncharacterized protein